MSTESVHTENQREGQREELNWLDQVHDILEWRIDAPKVADPFSPLVPIAIVRKLATDEAYLYRRLKLSGCIQGFEVIRITSISKRRYTSEHPCISRMNLRDIKDYFIKYKLDDWLSKKIIGIQKDYQEELEKREAQNRQRIDTASIDKKTFAAMRKDKKAAKREVEGPIQGGANSFYSGGNKDQK